MRNVGRPMRAVPLKTWLDRLRKDPSNPAYPVLDQYEQLLFMKPVLETDEARRAAGGLVDCEVDLELLGRYVQYACTRSS